MRGRRRELARERENERKGTKSEGEVKIAAYLSEQVCWCGRRRRRCDGAQVNRHPRPCSINYRRQSFSGASVQDDDADEVFVPRSAYIMKHHEHPYSRYREITGAFAVVGRRVQQRRSISRRQISGRGQRLFQRPSKWQVLVAPQHSPRLVAVAGRARWCCAVLLRGIHAHKNGRTPTYFAASSLALSVGDAHFRLSAKLSVAGSRNRRTERAVPSGLTLSNEVSGKTCCAVSGTQQQRERVGACEHTECARACVRSVRFLLSSAGDPSILLVIVTEKPARCQRER